LGTRRASRAGARLTAALAVQMQTGEIDTAIDELASDVEKALAMLQQKDTQFNRRLYVRSLFAYLEGFTYWIRQNAIEIDKIVFRKFGAMDWERHLLLHEDLPTIADNGKIERQRQKTSFKNRFAFSVRAYAEIVHCKDNLFSDNGWRQLQDALKVRNRLTHPKQSSDLDVSDDDVKACQEGYTWFANLVVKKFKESAKAMMKN
jgi:hypothetical protein